MDPVTIVGRRFHSGGVPWFSTTHFLWNTPTVFSHVYWSGDITSGQKSGILNTIAAQGFNAMDIYTLNEGDYGSRRVTPFSNGAFSGGFDNAKLASWRADLINIINMGIRPFLWTRADDSPAINGMSQSLYETYLSRMVQEFDDLPIMWVLGLEVDEYWSLATSNARGTYLQSIATQPVGIHQLVGQTNFMTPSWVQFGMYQGVHPNNNPTWQNHFDAVLAAKAAIGNKPLVWSEYQQSGSNGSLTFQARQFGLAGSFAGAAGYGNGGPPGLGEFMESLPANMTSSRTGNIITMTGSGVTARADMTTLAFEIVPPPAADRTSNVFAVNWTRPAAPPVPGGYTPFPFVTRSDPSISHAGVTNRPGYSPTNPPSASIIDPMSGLTLFRLGGNTGSTVFINGTQNSGLAFPRVLRQPNNPSMRQSFNADGSLLMIGRHYSRSGDPSNSCRSYLVDVTGTRGASAPWRILRASSGTNLGVGNWFFWDPLNPLRAYIINNNGSISEWWPIGAPGHPQNQITQIHGPVPSGFGDVHSGDRDVLHTSLDGQWMVVQARRNSDGRFGGFRRNLVTGAMGPFVVSPDWQYGTPHSGDRVPGGISALAAYTTFAQDGQNREFKSLLTGASLGTANRLSHTCWVNVNGRDFLCGVQTDNIDLWDVQAGTRRALVTVDRFRGNNPNHAGSMNRLDTFENFPATGSGGTSGHRHILYARSGDRQGHPRGILAIRCGPNDLNQIIYLCNHRSQRTDNSNECHPQCDALFRHVVFNSDWSVPGAASSNQVNPYILLVPNAIHSPNNNGS